MKTHVIPWMSKEETDRLIQEMRDAARSKGTETKPATVKIPVATEREADKRDSKALEVGGF